MSTSVAIGISVQSLNTAKNTLQQNQPASPIAGGRGGAVYVLEQLSQVTVKYRQMFYIGQRGTDDGQLGKFLTAQTFDDMLNLHGKLIRGNPV